MTRILHISDGHGYLPVADASLEIDMVCFTGDEIAEYRGNIGRQHVFCIGALEPALAAWGVPVVGIPGNHTHIAADLWGISVMREIFEATGGAYLVDETVEVAGLTLHGSPWTRPTNNSVFIEDELLLGEYWSLIPEGVDALLTHGPPEGWLDRGYGSPSLRTHVNRVRPRVHMFGHVHSAAGIDGSPVTIYSNSSIVGSDMKPLGLATIIDLNADGTVDIARVGIEIKDHLSAA